MLVALLIHISLNSFFTMSRPCPICREPSARNEVRNTFNTTLDVCSLCLRESIQDPQILTCGHGHCESCTSDLFNHQRVDDQDAVDTPHGIYRDYDYYPEYDPYVDYDPPPDYAPYLNHDSQSDFDPYFDYEPYMDFDSYRFTRQISDPTPVEQEHNQGTNEQPISEEPGYNPNWVYYHFTDARATDCWDFIRINKVHIPTEQYPVPDDPMCCECLCNAPDGVHVHDTFNHTWKWVCCVVNPPSE